MTAWSSTEKQRLETITDSSGAYTFLNMPPANDYVLSAFAPNYPVIYYPSAKDETTANQIDMTRGNVTDINFQLDKGYIIRGTVFLENTSQTALAGVWVNIWSESKNMGIDCPTNEDGAYEFKGLDPNTTDYIISIKIQGYMPVWYNDNNDTDLYNDTSYTIEQITNIVELYHPNLYRVYNRQTRTTDADKNDVNGYVTDIDFTIIEGFETLSGTVTFPDNAKAGEKAYIEAYSDKTSTFGSAQVIYSTKKTVQYKISGLMNATDYVVMIESDNYQVQYFNQQYTVDYATHIDTTDATADNAVNITLYSGGSICGKTYDNDQPASDIIVVAYSNKTNAFYGTISQDNGRYCIYYGLGMSDDYELKASRSSDTAPFYYNETKTSRDQKKANKINILEQKYQSGLDIYLTQLESISGTIRDQYGQPVYGIW